MFFKKLELSDASLVAGAVVDACRAAGWSNALQPYFLRILFKNFLGLNIDFASLPPISSEVVKQAFDDHEKRVELIDLMLAVELLCHEIPVSVSKSIEAWAASLGVHNQRVNLVRELAAQSLAVAQSDFYRNNYFSVKDKDLPHFHDLVEQYGLPAYMLTMSEDESELARWEALALCHPDSLGKHFWNFYKKRGFQFPGSLGGINVAVAHHDWIHILADYDSDGIGEMEVAAFSAFATKAIAPTMNFMGTLSIFQGGLLQTIVGDKPHLGHELEVHNGAERLVDAFRRGRACSVELIEGMDFFEHANTPLEELRLQWNILPKSI
jgi:hypothetical protein